MGILQHPCESGRDAYFPVLFGVGLFIGFQMQAYQGVSGGLQVTSHWLSVQSLLYVRCGILLFFVGTLVVEGTTGEYVPLHISGRRAERKG
jgi:hypothetical protein